MTGTWISLGERGCVANLDRQLSLGPVQHGLAVKADDVDVVEAHPVLRDKGGHRLGMRCRDDPLGLAQAAGPRRRDPAGRRPRTAPAAAEPRSVSV